MLVYKVSYAFLNDFVFKIKDSTENIPTWCTSFKLAYVHIFKIYEDKILIQVVYIGLTFGFSISPSSNQLMSISF